MVNIQQNACFIGIKLFSYKSLFTAIVKIPNLQICVGNALASDVTLTLRPFQSEYTDIFMSKPCPSPKSGGALSYMIFLLPYIWRKMTFFRSLTLHLKQQVIYISHCFRVQEDFNEDLDDLLWSTVCVPYSYFYGSQVHFAAVLG